MNKVILIGNLTRDPEISRKQGDNGKTTIIGKFDLAVGKKFRSENAPESDFFHCVIFGKSAEFLENYFKKSSASFFQRNSWRHPIGTHFLQMIS